MTLLENDAPVKRKAGRPPGIKNTQGLRSRARIRELEREHMTPVEIMLENMTFWHRHSQAMTEKVGITFTALQALTSNPLLVQDENFKEMFKELSKKLMSFMSEMLSARHHSQGCAVDAAPYCHPKYISIQAELAEPVDITPSQMPTDPIEASRTYQRMISGR